MSPRMRRRGLPLAVAACFCVLMLAAPLVARPSLGVVAAAVGCLVVLAWMLARLGDPRLAAYGLAALVTMPLFFVEARSMPRDLAALAGNTAAFAGALLLSFDRPRALETRARVTVHRAIAVALLAVGLVVGGVFRGALLGVAQPLLGAGLAGLTSTITDRSERAPRKPGVAHQRWLGVALFAGGVVAIVVGVSGAPAVAGPKPTFDVVLERMSHALFPWSALLPIAFASLLSGAPRAGGRCEALRAAATGSIVAAFAVHGFAPAGATTPFVAPAAIATAVALALRDLDKASASTLLSTRPLAIVCALLVGLLAHDFELEPARAVTSMMPLAAGGTGATAVPMSPWLGRASTVLALVLSLVTFDGPTDLDDLLARLTAWLSTLAELWHGHLATALVAIEAMLVSFALWTALSPTLGQRGPALSDQARLAVRHAFWIFPALVVGIVWIPLCLTAGLTRLRSMSSLSRGELCALAGAGAGVLFAFTCFSWARS